VAWCDVQPERLRKRREKFPEIAGYADYRELLRHPGLDLVVIATPNEFHCEMACAFLEAGIHVCLEKPMGITRCEMDRLLEVARRSTAQLAVDVEMRVSPFAAHAMSLI